ncbi:MAG: hypothetical protein HYY85_20240 [Deltaproteobacteria bacterium]|nr:hypothetical protein [Deltaproteobacteria bacterium]
MRAGCSRAVAGAGRACLLGGVVLALVACASPGSIPLDLRYTLTTPTNRVSDLPGVLAMEQVFDARRDKGQIGMALNRPVIPTEPVDRKVSAAVWDHFEQAGYRVIQLSRGGSFDEAKARQARALLGGSIENFWVEATASGLKVNTQARVRLRLVLADARTRETVWQGAVEGQYGSEEFRYGGFNEAVLRQDLARALSSTVDNILANVALREKLATLLRP